MAGEEQAQDLGRRQRPLRLQVQQGGADLLGQAGGDSGGARPRQQVAVDDACVCWLVCWACWLVLRGSRRPPFNPSINPTPNHDGLVISKDAPGPVSPRAQQGQERR